jgi:hypothetical protein
VIRRRLSILVLLVALAGALAGCTVNGTVIATEQERESFPTGETPLVIVETFNGRISIQPGPNDTVDARVTLRGSGTSDAAAKRDLANVRVDFERIGDRILITARRVDQEQTLGNSGADVEVAVPPGSSLELRTSNGRVESANIAGSILVRTSNGPITTRGGTDLDLDTTNGQISVNNPAGKVHVRTSNGGIDILAARNASLNAQTSNSTVTFSGTLADGTHTITTSNGDIAVTLPGDATFTFNGQTSNGFVRTEFVDLDVTDTSITGSVGEDPAVTIVAVTSNGDLSVLTQKP